MRVAVARAGHGHVDGEHEGGATAGRRAAHQLAHEAAVADHVELEPERLGRGGGTSSSEHTRQGGEAHRDAFRGGDALAATSPRRAYMPLRPIGPRPTGRRWRRPKNSVGELDAGDVAEHALAQGDGGEVVDVPAQGHFLVGGAVDVVEQEAGQAAPGGAAEVGGGGDDHGAIRSGWSSGARSGSPWPVWARCREVERRRRGASGSAERSGCQSSGDFDVLHLAGWRGDGRPFSRSPSR